MVTQGGCSNAGRTGEESVVTQGEGVVTEEGQL